MAKYIKTEDGYKQLNEIEGSINLTAGDYIELKDGIIRTTFGDPAEVIREEVVSQYCDRIIGTMEYNPSHGGYQTLLGQAPPPENQEILEIEITNASGVLVFKGEAEFMKSSRGGRVNFQEEIAIVFDKEYVSFDQANIFLIYPTNITGHHIKLKGKTKTLIDGNITLPKTALNYDDEPKEFSDNLLTSRVIYLLVRDLQLQITGLNYKITTLENKINQE